MRIHKSAAAFGVALFVLSACAKPAPEPIYAQPVYDKYGAPSGYSCPAGEILDNSIDPPVCVTPPDDCEIIPGTNQCYPDNAGRPADSGRSTGGGQNTGRP